MKKLTELFKNSGTSAGLKKALAERKTGVDLHRDTTEWGRRSRLDHSSAADDNELSHHAEVGMNPAVHRDAEEKHQSVSRRFEELHHATGIHDSIYRRMARHHSDMAGYHKMIHGIGGQHS